jgi:acetyl esterase/lipase
LVAKAGIKERVGKKGNVVGAMSGSCKLLKESLSREIVDQLNKKGVAVVGPPGSAARWAMVVAVACAFVAGCGGSTAIDERPPASVATPPGASGSSVVAQDLEYASQDPDGPWSPHLMDIYASGKGQGLPLVVIFHGGALRKGGSAYPRIAEDLVARGAVVASADWTDRAPAALLDMGESLDAIVARGQQTVDEMACAVDFAVSQAPKYGADPTRLVLVGHSAGANMTSMLGLGPNNPFPGCAAPDVQWAPRGLMLWEGDWLAADPAGDWDSFGDDLGTTVLETVTPWGLLARAPAIPVVFAVSDTSRRAMRRCGDTETVDWLAMRDPDGSLEARLDAVGATDDGCIDAGEADDVLADAMAEQGIPAEVMALRDPTTTHTHLAAPDLTLVVDRISEMARG